MLWTEYLVFGLGGLVTVLGFTGILNRSRKGQRIARLLGEFGARIFYTLIGIGMILIGLLV